MLLLTLAATIDATMLPKRVDWRLGEPLRLAAATSGRRKTSQRKTGA
jgi:hypothetical protein